MATFTKLYLMLALLFSSSAILVQAKGGGFFKCFGCGWAFPCNALVCPLTGRPARTLHDHSATFNLDTVLISTSGVGIRNIEMDTNFGGDAENDPTTGGIAVLIQHTRAFPAHADVPMMSLRFGEAEPIQVNNPDIIRGRFIRFDIPATVVNNEILRSGRTVIRCTLAYELDTELK